MAKAKVTVIFPIFRDRECLRHNLERLPVRPHGAMSMKLIGVRNEVERQAVVQESHGDDWLTAAKILVANLLRAHLFRCRAVR